MMKIPCLFRREFHDRGSFTLTDEVSPNCGWVLTGSGRATCKWDGTACMVTAGILFRRFDRKMRKDGGGYKDAPPGWIAADDPDATTGHWPGWVPVGDEPESKWHREALANWSANTFGGLPPDGTYELLGPKVQDNQHGLASHALKPHGNLAYSSVERTFLGIRKFLAEHEIEGLVFHHDDGRMAKIRRDDYGLPWGQRKNADGRWLRLDGVRHTATCAVVVGDHCNCGGLSLARSP